MRITKSALIAEKSISWLWPGRIPIGCLTILEGDPGTGKSQITASLAAHISNGLEWPDGERCPQGEVILANAEDPAEEVIIPRLKAAGANLERCFVIVPEEKDTQLFTIPDNVAELEGIVRERAVRLIVFDPLEAFLSASVDNYRNHHVRRALKSLELLAARTGCAVVIVRHLTKDAQKAAIYRGSGSIGIIGAARSGLSVGRDPTDKNRCIMVPTKANWAKMRPGYAYKVEDHRYVVSGHEIATSRVKWDAEVNVSADEILTVVEGQVKGQAGDAAVKSFLESELASGPKTTKELLLKGGRLGFKKDDIWRVSKFMDVNRYKAGPLSDGEWTWELMSAEDKEVAASWATEDLTGFTTAK